MAFVRAGASASLKPEGGESAFERRLVDLMNSFMFYEQKTSQTAALAAVPLEDLTLIAEAKYDSISSTNTNTPGTTAASTRKVELRDFLFLELLNWFKTEFFTWMDSPPCPLCGTSPTIHLSEGMPTFEERSDSAARVETFTCHKCYPPAVGSAGAGAQAQGKEVARFPRYNDPVILLRTRTGRCGEWANCFALICRAAGYEVRHVTDWTDHVWVEVYSESQGRWMHADPCENTCDNPLLYESGWGKKLSYVIAVSQDDIQDVTWRYSHSDNHAEVLRRRNRLHGIREVWLVKAIMALRHHRQSWLPEARKKILQERLIKELIEFMTPTKGGAKESEKVGRESGSLAWRTVRGEIQQQNSNSNAKSKSKPFEWILSNEKDNFNLTYDSVQDKYISRYSDAPEGKEVKGWAAGVYTQEGIVRKEEQDWKMVYLARHESTSCGKISWKFNIPTTKSFKSLAFRLQSTKFHPTASITLEITTSSKIFKVPESNCDANGKWEWEINQDFFTGDNSWFTLTCTLAGGQSWQHAQLFRQKMNPDSDSDADSSPGFTINITYG